MFGKPPRFFALRSLRHSVSILAENHLLDWREEFTAKPRRSQRDAEEEKIVWEMKRNAEGAEDGEEERGEMLIGHVWRTSAVLSSAFSPSLRFDFS